MRTNRAGLEIIKSSEGLSLTPYRDSGHVWTIGWGHTKGVTQLTQPITEAEAEDLLREDIEDAERNVASVTAVSLTRNQFSALVSLRFNIGEGAFRRSTLLKLLNKGDFLAAADQFPRWVYDNGIRYEGLAKRRAKERELFLRPADAA